ncbi:MAG: hypothetical protein Q8O95_00250 [bacterium]|nr:hypothetical protein [bacterium]
MPYPEAERELDKLTSTAEERLSKAEESFESAKNSAGIGRENNLPTKNEIEDSEKQQLKRTHRKLRQLISNTRELIGQVSTSARETEPPPNETHQLLLNQVRSIQERIQKLPDEFEVIGVTVGTNFELIPEQGTTGRPDFHERQLEPDVMEVFAQIEKIMSQCQQFIKRYLDPQSLRHQEMTNLKRGNSRAWQTATPA